MDEMHEVRGQQDGAAGGYRQTAEEPLDQQIDRRQHQDPEEGPHEPPSEGVESEQGNAQRQDDLSQRWMRDLVGVEPVEMLVGGADVIHLIKIGAVHEGDGFRHRVLFIQQGTVGDVRGKPVRRDQFPIAAVQADLTKIQFGIRR